MNHSKLCLALAALLPLPLAQAVLAQAPTPGERWRTTMSMEMMGMKVPGMTSEVCAPKNASGTSAPPPPANEDCKVSNQRTVGKTTSFDMQCKDGMSGRMEMTAESDTRWSGKMTANTSDGTMTMRMTSEKLPGACDASEMERRMNKMIAESNAQQAQFCLEGARSASSDMFVGPAAACKDKASVDAYCANARTMPGYNALARRQRMAAGNTVSVSQAWRTAIADTGRLCGFAPETLRTQHCSTAQGKKEWTFFAEECPETARPLAQRECAGRDFTNPVAPAYRDFCSAYAAAGRSAGAPTAGAAPPEAAPDAASGPASASAQGGNAPEADAPAKPTDKAKEAMQKGREALKGLFGR